MANELRDLAQTLLDEPVTQSPPAQGFLGGLGESLDAQTVLDRAALKMRYTSGPLMQSVAAPLGIEVIPTAGDPERLRRAGAAKGLTRYATESDVQFEARIENALAAATLLSTVAGLKRQIIAYGIPDVAIIEECYSALGGDGADYGYKFVVVLGPDFGVLGWTPLVLPFSLGASFLGVIGARSAQFSDLVRIILAWKSASSFPLAIVCRFGAAPLLGVGLNLPFILGGAAGTGYIRRPVGEQALLGAPLLPFALWGGYSI